MPPQKKKLNFACSEIESEYAAKCRVSILYD